MLARRCANACEVFMTITPKQMRAARRLLGWSQDHLAGLLGVSDAAISAFERSARSGSGVGDGARALFERAGVEFDASGEDVRLSARGGNC